MQNRKRAIMKKIIGLMILTLFLTGCGKTGALPDEADRSRAIIEEPENTIIEEDNSSEEGTEKEEKEQITSYVIQGEPFRKSVFAPGDKGILLCGIDQSGQYFLGSVSDEDQQLTRFACNIPDGMRVVSIANDSYGNAHVLLMSTEKIEINGEVLDQLDYKKTEIQKLSASGNILDVMDVSGAVSGKLSGIPRSFYVDDNGWYYLDAGSDIVILDEDSVMADCHTVGGRVTAIGQGRSGIVYATYFDGEGRERVKRLDNDDAGIALPDMEIASSKIFAGKENELLIYNKSGGVFALLEADAEEVCLLTELSALPVSGDDVAGCGFMKDARLCLLEIDDDKSIIYYIGVE